MHVSFFSSLQFWHSIDHNACILWFLVMVHAALEHRLVKQIMVCVELVLLTTRILLVRLKIHAIAIMNDSFVFLIRYSSSRWSNYDITWSTCINIIRCKYIYQKCFMGVRRLYNCLTMENRNSFLFMLIVGLLTMARKWKHPVNW